MLNCLVGSRLIQRDLVREAQKVAFQGPLGNVWNMIHLRNHGGKEGVHKGYHGTNLRRVLDQALKGAFDPGRRVYVADPQELHVSLNYSHQAVSSFYAPHNACFDPEENVCLAKTAALCGVVLGISSDTRPVFNAEAEYDRDSRFQYFPPGAEVYINELLICHPRLRFVESFDDNYGQQRLYAYLWDCPSEIREAIQDPEVTSLISRLNLSRR